MPVELETDQMLPWGLLVQQHFNEQFESLNSEGKRKGKEKIQLSRLVLHDGWLSQCLVCELHTTVVRSQN